MLSTITLSCFTDITRLRACSLDCGYYDWVVMTMLRLVSGHGWKDVSRDESVPKIQKSCFLLHDSLSREFVTTKERFYRTLPREFRSYQRPS